MYPNPNTMFSYALARDRASGRLTRRPAWADIRKSVRRLERIAEQLSQVAEARPAADEPESLLTVQDVARRLGVSVRTVETLIASGELVPLRIRNARRFPPEAVEAYLRSIAGPRRRRR